MNRALLEKPFLAAEIRQREGGNGKILDYVEGHVVVARLNDAFDGNWDFIVKSFDVNEARGEVLVVGRLTAEGITKMQFGSSSITRHKTTKEPVSIADDLKAAATDALKKCATLFGVALSLRAGIDSRSQPVPSPDPVPAPAPTSQKRPDLLSPKQHSYLRNLSRDLGQSRDDLNALCLERFGVKFDNLNKGAASTLINELSSQEPPPLQMQRSVVAKLQDSYI